jgi:hypothetical protein
MRAKKFKYKNQPTELDGHRFDSKREANRYAELKLLQMGGKVRGLKRQVRFRIDVHDEHICDYIADFCYEELRKDGLWWSVVEDVKGMKTEVYKLKRRLMLAVHNVQILET